MDPFGHSAIVDKRVKKRELKGQELQTLKAGSIAIFEKR
jgi:C4-type Zn-finger protein